MRRSRARLEHVAEHDRLARAFWRAARGKRERPDVAAFESRLECELARLAGDVIAGSYRPEPLRSFTIHDPKTRTIRAPGFRDRVLHHALADVIGPVLDRALVADTYACRVGRGSAAALDRSERHLRRFAWYAKLDVVHYFASIDHARLVEQLERRFRDRGLVALCARIVAAYAEEPDRGLPIGALTSQHLANHFLGPLDRYLLEEVKVGGLVRYMDDVVVFTRAGAEARAALQRAEAFAKERLGLGLHRLRVQRSSRGLTFLGVRLKDGRRSPSLRRRRRYRAARKRWEAAFRAGAIDTATLQRGYAAALAVTARTRAHGLRRRDLEARPAADA